MAGAITIPCGKLWFDAVSAGRPGDPLVLLLHGFPQTNHSWRHQLEPLAQAGFHAVAPNQRGYSPGARPAEVRAYSTDALVADVLDMIDALGHDGAHVVGHDWGGQISWLTAAFHPERVISLTVLSRPHPAAFAAAMQSDPKQSERSKHHRSFQNADTVALMLADDAARLRGALVHQGVPDSDVEAYLSVLADPDTLEAAVSWYRAGGPAALQGDAVPAVPVPTTYIWGDADATVGRTAAEGTAGCVTGEYRFEVLPGVGHFVTDQNTEDVNRMLLERVGGVER